MPMKVAAFMLVLDTRLNKAKKERNVLVDFFNWSKRAVSMDFISLPRSVDAKGYHFRLLRFSPRKTTDVFVSRMGNIHF